MKIFFIQDGLINAGAERSHLELLCRFNITKVGLVYFYPHHDLKDAYLRGGIPLYFLNLSGKYDLFRGCVRLIKLIKRERPDLLVSCLFRSNLMARVASVITGVPLVGTLVSDSYGEAKISMKSTSGRLKFKFIQFADRLTSSIPCHWIANSKAVLRSNSARLNIKEYKATVIYRGRDKNNFTPWVGWKRTEFVFITVGRLLRGKGFGDLIKSIKVLQNYGIDVRLVICGDGIHRREFEAFIEENRLSDMVELLGEVLNVNDRLMKADCFVFPSWYEGFSGALVEAMMTGIPIIASDIPMNMEAITPGVNGLSFKVKDVYDLADKMKYAVSHREEMAALGAKAREDSMLRFDIDNIAKQYELKLIEIYSNLKKGI